MVQLGAVTAVLFTIKACMDEKPEKVATERAAVPPAPAIACPEGVPAPGRYFVTGKGVPLRTGPGDGFPAVVNARMGDARVLSPSYVLAGLCASGEWLYAEIVEVDRSPVRWEKGWVRQAQVSTTPTGDSTLGLLWDIDADIDIPAADRVAVRAGALKVLHDERNCAAVTTGVRSSSKPGTYFVTCTPKGGGGPFNVWFTPAQANGTAPLAVPTAYPEIASREACEREIRARVTNPSTLDLHRVIGYATTVHNNGNRTVLQDFAAKNSLGQEAKYQARCLVLPTGAVEVTITDAQ
ncbi:MAG: hypothetical protein BGO92_18630 [Magnetospirillum sp. 64-120]|nr:MAG: hypothetical protein BGO92_18630 [Magnetospirillum sp. 64-120]